jgi:RNA polymerase subunit RPABC4/transcription elongation factor Spt4
VPQQLETIIQIAMALIGAYVAALWFCLVIWTFRDIQKRTRDVLVQILASLLVLLFNVPGLILYLILRPPETLSDVYARGLAEESLSRDIAGRTLCPGCQGRIEPDWRICPMCRATLKEPCGSCGKLVQVGWAACPYCTHSLGTPIRPVAHPPTQIYTATPATSEAV